MGQAKKYPFDIPANGSFPLLVKGKFFRIISCMGPVDAVADLFKLDSIQTGEGLEETPFDRIVFRDRTGATNSVVVLVSDEAFISSPTLNAAITANKNPQSASFVTTPKQPGAASGVMVAANSARQYLMVQNRHASATVYICPGAGPATVGDTGNGIKIGPGQFWEFDSIASTQAWQYIADAAFVDTRFLVTEG